MKVKFQTIILLSFIILICIFISTEYGNNENKEKILTKSLNQIENVKVIFNRREIVLNSDTVEQIYNILQKTKARSNFDLNSEPKFILIFEYKDGTSDIIKTSENGRFFYRYLSESNSTWIGSKNDKILPLINSTLVAPISSDIPSHDPKD